MELLCRLSFLRRPLPADSSRLPSPNVGRPAEPRAPEGLLQLGLCLCQAHSHHMITMDLTVREKQGSEWKESKDPAASKHSISTKNPYQCWQGILGTNWHARPVTHGSVTGDETNFNGKI